MHPVGCLLRLARCGEDGLGIVLEDLEPRGDIGSMIGPWMVSDTEISEDKPADSDEVAPRFRDDYAP